MKTRATLFVALVLSLCAYAFNVQQVPVSTPAASVQCCSGNPLPIPR